MARRLPSGGDVGHLLASLFASHQVVDLTLQPAGEQPCIPQGNLPAGATACTSTVPAADAGGDRLPPLAAAGPADVVDVTGSGDAPRRTSPPVTPVHLERWEDLHGPVHPGDVVLLRSGWDGGYLPGWPAPTPAAIEWLRERGVVCVGTDGLWIGPAGDGAHLPGLAKGMTFVEALAGLGQLPPRGAWFMFVAIRLSSGIGAPGRALAVLPGPGE